MKHVVLKVVLGAWLALGLSACPDKSTPLTPPAPPPPTSPPTPPPAPPPPPSSNANLMGLNVDFTADYSPNRPFADAMRQARNWEKLAGGTPAQDADGWPLEDARVTVWHGIARMNGTYKLSFTGQADVRISCCAGTISGVAFDATRNETTANLVYDAKDGVGLFLEFKNTRLTPASNLNSGVKDVKLMRPITEGGSSSYDPSVQFTTPFKDSLRRFQVLRFMDWLATNANLQQHWNERVTPQMSSQAVSAPGYGWQGRGASYETAIDLCNELDKDCWLTVPAMADDDYVRNLATLVKSRLEASLKVYVEFSNEVWNFGGAFEQSRQNLALAKTEVAAGSSPLAFDGTTNEFYWGWRRVAKRGLEVSLIFRSVFGDAPMITRVRRVLMTQLGYADGPLQQAALILQGYYNDPARTASPHPPGYYFYGIGGSAYLDPKTPGTPDETLANLPDASTWSKAIQADTNYAAAFGLRRVAYEGGPSLEGGSITDANRPAIRDDPRMKDAMVAAHDLWSANGGDLLVYFTAVGESPWGFVPDVWDATNTAKNLKLQAIDALNTRPRAKITYGTPLPATLDATKYNVPASYVFNPQPTTPGEWFGYTVRADDTGAFKITLSVKSADANGKLDVLVDGALVGTLDAPNTGSGAAQDTSAIPITLEPGLHGIIVRGKAGSVSLEQIKISR